MTPQPFEEMREEILVRIESSRKYDWTGGFEPEFLADFVLSHFHQKLLSLKESMEGEKKPQKYESYEELEGEELADWMLRNAINQTLDTAISLLGMDNEKK